VATTVAALQAVLTADTRHFDRAMGSSESKMKRVGRTAGIAGAAIAGGLGIAAKIGFDELMEGQRVAAQTNAVLKSTGGVANVSAKQIDLMADSMLRKTGIDDEQIKTGANMLLTFTRIRNEVGRGNDIFNQATRATTDLSVAMGKDMKSSAILVGKALNDPVRGLTALRRVGVAFTKGQQEQIKAMVESGNTMGAQKMILKELRTEFGGSAEAAGKTLSGQMNIAKESFKNLTAELVTALLPAFNKLVGWLTKATGWMSEHKTATKVIIGVVAGLAATLLAVGAAMKVYAAGQAIAAAATWLFVGSAEKASAISKVWAAAQWVLNASFMGFPLILIVAGLIALGAALVLAWKRSETFRNVVTGALDAITGAFETLRKIAAKVIDFLVDGFKITPLGFLLTHIGDFVRIAQELPGQIASVIGSIPGKIAAGITSVYNKASELGTKIVSGAVAGVTGIGNAVWGVVTNIGTRIGEGVGTILGWGMNVGTWLKNAVRDAVVGIGNAVWNVVNNIWEFISERVAIIRGWGTSVGNWLKDAVRDAVVGIGGAVWNVINNIWEFIQERADAIKGWGDRIGTWIKNAIVDGLAGLGRAVAKEIKDQLSPDLFGPKSGIGIVRGWIGDPSDPDLKLPSAGTAGAIFADSTISQSLWDELGLARKFGLVLTSGYRPGAITKHGTPSDHGVFPSKAIDVSGTASAMAAYFMALIGNRGVKQAFYDPLGSIFGGARSGYREGGHSDHVHVATYDKGGWLPPGLSLARNLTGVPERVISPGSERQIIINLGGLIDKADAGRWIQSVIRGAGRDGIIIDQPQPGF
jgi:phage-related protein